MRLLWICKSADLWVELSKDNIEYVAAAIKASPPEQPKVCLGGVLVNVKHRLQKSIKPPV